MFVNNLNQEMLCIKNYVGCNCIVIKWGNIKCNEINN